jgi:uncharacterized protein
LRQVSTLITILIFVSACSNTTTAPNPKLSLELSGRVVDKADLLNRDTEAKLSEKLAAAHRAYGQQLVVVTTPSLNGKRIEDYGVNLGRSWGVGDRKRNDGLILIVAPQERKVRIEVGYGLEASFSDQFTGAILRENILPAFSDGEFATGIEAGVDRMIEKMRDVPSLPNNDNSASTESEKAA